MTKWIIEHWNPSINKYERYGEYPTIERAEIMFNKRYFRRLTRRLIRIQEEVLYVERGMK